MNKSLFYDNSHYALMYLRDDSGEPSNSKYFEK